LVFVLFRLLHQNVARGWIKRPVALVNSFWRLVKKKTQVGLMKSAFHKRVLIGTN